MEGEKYRKRQAKQEQLKRNSLFNFRSIVKKH